MVEYVLEGTIKKIEHDATGMALQFVPDAGFVSRRKDADGELTFVALQPKNKTCQGLLLSYTDIINITVKNPNHVYRVGKVRFEFVFPSKSGKKKKLDACGIESVNVSTSAGKKNFDIIRVIES